MHAWFRRAAWRLREESRRHFHQHWQHPVQSGIARNAKFLTKNFACTAIFAYASFQIAESFAERRRKLSTKSRKEFLFGSFPTVATRQKQNIDSFWKTWIPNDIKYAWNRLREREKTIYCIIAVNVAVFVASYSRRLQPLYSRFFVSRVGAPFASNLASAFAHASPTHLAVNMFALQSLGAVAHDFLGREHFLAFFASAAACSSFCSLMLKASRHCNRGSVGASGAVCALLGLLTHFPQLQVALVFLPLATLSVATGALGMALFDACGVILRWHVFDHAAHLGGLAFGYIFVQQRRKK